MKKKDEKNRRSDLRSKAAETPVSKSRKSQKGVLPDLEALVHENKTHRVELEMQDEELRCARRDVEQSQRRYADLYDFAPIGYFVLDSYGTVLSCNLTGARMLGYDKSAISHMPFTVFIVEEDHNLFFSHLSKAFAGQGMQVQELRARTANGTILAVQLQSISFENDPSALISCRTALIDVTQERRSAEELRQSEARFRLFARTAERLLSSPNPQAIVNDLCREVMAHLKCDVFINYVIDPTGRLFLNAYEGIPASEARKIEWLDYGVAVCGCVARDGKRIIAEDIQHVPDERTDFVRGFGVQAYCCHPLMNLGQLIGTLSFGTRSRQRFTEREIEVMRTVADQVAVAMQRVQVEEALRQFSAMLERRVEERTAAATALSRQLRELASELTMAEHRERQRLGKVLHDHIQQLLVAARLQTDVLMNRRHGDPDALESARVIGGLLDQTLSASRTLTAELSPPVLYEGGLDPALHWLARSLKEKHGLDVEIKFDPSAEPVVEDVRLFLFEAVREILFNTVKHSGVMKARVEATRSRDCCARILVSDEGKGFDPSKWRLSRSSAGFGLFGIQQRLENMGGRLEIDSAPGEGARITMIGPMPPEVRLKVSEEEGEPRPAQLQRTGSAARHGGTIRVLLADDHHIVRQGLASFLRMEPGIEIVGEASDGVQAINLTRVLHPNVVIMDVSMPGVNGIEATREIVREFPDIRVIGLSMHEDGEMTAAMRQAGAIAYVAKGGPPEVLISQIHSAATFP